MSIYHTAGLVPALLRGTVQYQVNVLDDFSFGCHEAPTMDACHETDGVVYNSSTSSSVAAALFATTLRLLLYTHSRKYMNLYIYIYINISIQYCTTVPRTQMEIKTSCKISSQDQSLHQHTQLQVESIAPYNVRVHVRTV